MILLIYVIGFFTIFIFFFNGNLNLRLLIRSVLWPVELAKMFIALIMTIWQTIKGDK